MRLPNDTSIIDLKLIEVWLIWLHYWYQAGEVLDKINVWQGWLRTHGLTAKVRGGCDCHWRERLPVECTILHDTIKQKTLWFTVTNTVIMEKWWIIMYVEINMFIAMVLITFLHVWICPDGNNHGSPVDSPHIRAGNAEFWCFICFQLEYAVVQTIDVTVMLDLLTLI